MMTFRFSSIRLSRDSRIAVGVALMTAFTGLTARVAYPHGAAPIKIAEKIEIAAKPEVVWSIVGDFAKISAWNPMVTTSMAASDERQGKERVITLKSGGQITDALTDYDEGKMTYSYRRVDDDVQVFPVSFYSGTIKLSPSVTGTQVEWTGGYYRADTSNDPPENLNDDVAKKAMTDFFETGLNNLKTLAERKSLAEQK
jgi:mxaD protein